MEPEQNSNHPHHIDETVFIGELQKFTDPPGGVPLDDPKALARERRGIPERRVGQTSDEHMKSPDSK